MEYKTQKLISPIVDFIKTCPFIDEYSIDMEKVDTQRFSATDPPGTAIDYVGSTLNEDIIDVIGNRLITRQANFIIWLIRKSNQNLYRTEIAEFLYNFEQWIDQCQHSGATPKIGNYPNSEIMWAENGMCFSEWEGQDVSQYMIQLHITFQKDYEEEN